MGESVSVDRIAEGLIESVGLLVRRLRQLQAEGEPTLPERSALARLDRDGPATSAALARAEQITAQSMGSTLSGLEARGLIQRRPDPEDSRQVVLSITGAGLQALRNRRNVRTEKVGRALSDGFSPAELGQLSAATPLIERLAQRI